MNMTRRMARKIAKTGTLDEARKAYRQLGREETFEPREALRFTRNTRWNGFARLELIDALTQCHGVEAFKSTGGYWEYCNTGDSYAETVLLKPNGQFIVSSWGDIVESPRHARFERRNGLEP